MTLIEQWFWFLFWSTLALWFLKILFFGTRKQRELERARQARLQAARELTAGDRPQWAQDIIQWMDETFR